MGKKYNGNFFYRNSLSISFIFLFFIGLIGQVYTGWQEHNEMLSEYHQPTQNLKRYLSSGHFLQATFENWESEFFQMALFVIFTIFLRQQGSSESKACDDPTIDSKDLIPLKHSPWSVKKGGIYLRIYKHSLSICLMLLFILSFIAHWYGSWLDFNEKQVLEHKQAISFTAHIKSSKLWFESFQNWQSEFLSVFVIVFLSVYLRQIGSSQSKAVNASHHKTGSE